MVKQVTVNMYEKCYHRLCENGLKNNCSFLDLVTILNKFNIKDSTRNTYYKSLIYFNKKHNNILTDKCISEIQQDMKRINNNNFVRASKGILNKSQQKNYLQWDEILQVFDKVKTTETDKQKILLLAIFILFPPRRILDYQAMIYCKKIAKDHDKNKNYLVMCKNPYFIFNRYKTDKKYKTQKFYIHNQELIKIILDYIYTYNIKTNKSLFNLNYNNFIQKIRNTFFKYSGKNISANILRHSFISYQTKNNVIDIAYNRHKLALTMAHSASTSLNYFVNENI